jgi:enoyl-CoA hydratase/carnithine racemase
MAYETITTAKEGPAFIITFNRPEKRNAISTVVMDEMMHAAAAAEADDEVRGIIVTGGEKFFSAGADLNDAHAKAVIAAVEGFCMTGGCEFALACDLRIAAEDSSFAITSARIGTVAGAGGTQRLPRIVGTARALEIMLAAEPIDADAAYRFGLVNELTPKGGALARAKEIVDLYATRAPLSHAFIKRVVYNGMQMDLTSALDYEAFVVTSIYETEDRKEGIGAFLEKRPATFKGK